MWKKMRLFVKELFKSWIILVGGGAATLLLVLLQLPNLAEHLPLRLQWLLPVSIWIIVVGTLCIALFRAWAVQFDIRLKIQKRMVMMQFQNVHTMAISTTAISADYVQCSEKEILPALEELAHEGFLSRGAQPGTWRYSATANSVFGNFISKRI